MKNRNNKASRRDSRRVYSTEVGRTCPGCLRGRDDCVCKAKHATLNPSSLNGAAGGIGGDGVVRLHRETKGRKGKGVTLVKGLQLPAAELAALAKTLKAKCGVGGAVKQDTIELQTADRDKVKELLEAQGHTVKLAGG